MSGPILPLVAVGALAFAAEWSRTQGSQTKEESVSNVGRQQAVYYRATDGSEPVSAFIDTLEEHRQVALDSQIRRLNALMADEPPLPFPHSSQIDGQLRELRCHYGPEHYRILYRRSGNLLVLLHAFRKTTGAVLPADIKIAKDRWVEFETRMNAVRRVPPRAAGHDAP